MSYIKDLATKVKIASNYLANAGTLKKNEILMAISKALIDNTEFILSQNKLDCDVAIANGITKSLLDRLTLTSDRIKAISNSVVKVCMLNDPIGEVLDGSTRPNGLTILKKRVPLGVIGIIYEARPNVTVDGAVLCIKSSNAVVLRGGKEAINTNKALTNVMKKAIESVKFSPDIIALVEDTSREIATEMMKLNGLIDVLIPRGSATLINSCVQNATVPVIETGVGNCHLYVDRYADINKAVNISYNGKVSRPSVCNALENIIVHKDVAMDFLPKMKAKFDTANVQILGCSKTKDILGNDISLATDDDYKKEFLDYIISIKIVDNIDDAIQHINKYTTHHSEAIITENLYNATKFTDTIDACAVYINASTRFTDGEEFGYGSEIGVSTQKLHARGPMGINELTSYKYIVTGNGQIRT